MIWLTWRRHRAALGVFLVVLVGLAVWMAWLVHAFEAIGQSSACFGGGPRCAGQTNRFFSLTDQAGLINLALLAIPCGLGVVFGAPLVSSEIEQNTTRLMWTQSISRTRWLVSKWLVLLVPLAALAGLLTLEAQWWSSHVTEAGTFASQLAFSRVQPGFYPITGVVALAYVAFAFGLGSLVGSVVRRAGWAMFLTIVLYLAVSLLMVFVVRPNLAPQVFVPTDGLTARTPVVDTLASWNLGYSYRYAPGARSTESSLSPAAIEQSCERRAELQNGYEHCLAQLGVQGGWTYEPAANYWRLQWSEAAILVVVTASLFIVTVSAVRRLRD